MTYETYIAVSSSIRNYIKFVFIFISIVSLMSFEEKKLIVKYNRVKGELDRTVSSKEALYNKLNENPEFSHLLKKDPDFAEVRSPISRKKVGTRKMSQESGDLRGAKHLKEDRKMTAEEARKFDEYTRVRDGLLASHSVADVYNKINRDHNHLFEWTDNDETFRGLNTTHDDISEMIDSLNRLKVIEPRQVPKKKSSRTISQIPSCISTSDNIMARGQFGRYNQLRDYSILQTDFDYAYASVLGQNTDIGMLSLGIIRVEFDGTSIRYQKIGWQDRREYYIDQEINAPSFDRLMTDPQFKNYIDSYIIKSVQDKMVKDGVGSQLVFFDIMVNLYKDRLKSQADKYHQDHNKNISCDYFTLTYILRPNITMLGASILVNNGKDYSSATLPVSNLSTLAVSNYDMTKPRYTTYDYPQCYIQQYHSTPAVTTTRKFSNRSGIHELSDGNRPRIEPCRQVRLDRLTSSIKTYNLKTEYINIVPLVLDDLDESYAPAMDAILQASHDELRSFIRCWYCMLEGTPDGAFSMVYQIQINTQDLLNEIAIQYFKLSEMNKYFTGGSKKSVDLLEAIKMMQNPKNNMMVSYCMKKPKSYKRRKPHTRKKHRRN